MRVPIFQWRLRRTRIAAVVLAVVAAPLAAASAVAPHAAAATACPWVNSTAPIPTRVSELMAQMSLSQEIALMTGASGSSYVGNIPAISSLCIPAMNLEDGPAGVGDGMSNVTQLPAPVDVAATWDTAAEQEYGHVIGAEQAAKGSTVDLGPTINIVRDPRWGRAFESIGEDPYLAGQLAAADIRGVQSAGTMAQVKHYAVYNQETNRNSPSDNAVVSTEAEQEIYLPAFQAAVQQGAASSVMCSYSYINGTAACQNPYTLSTVLRQQFGYTGFVTSDWGATHSTAASANAGLDMDMPGNDGFYGSALQSAVTSGQVSQATINSAVSDILTQMFGFGMFDKVATGSPSAVATNSTDQADATQLAEEGTVLLKNSGSVLPLTSSDGSIAVIGADASSSPQTDGGGSAGVNSSGTVSPLQGIQAAAPSGTTVTYNDGSSDSSAASAAAAASVAVVFANLGESEGSDLSSIDLGTTQDNLITSVAAANPNTIVVLNTGSAVTMPWLSSVKGVLEAWYPGQEDGTAIANVLFGSYDPSGHLTVTFPTSLSQVPASTAAQFPGTDGNVQYSEGVDVGYRWYDSQGLTPLFPFGYGLSYTSFSFSNLHVGALTAGGAATVTATVTNTGSRSGADVAQLYVTDPSASGQPPLQLEGFQRVNLAAGASTTVTFNLTQQNLQYWNSSSNAWATPAGNYTVSVGRFQRQPAADRHPGRRLQPARRPGHPGQPRPAGQPDRQRRILGHPERNGRHQRPDADLLGDRPPGRPVDLRGRRHLRHPHRRRHRHGGRHREGRQRRLRHPELRVDRLGRHQRPHRHRHHSGQPDVHRRHRRQPADRRDRLGVGADADLRRDGPARRAVDQLLDRPDQRHPDHRGHVDGHGDRDRHHRCQRVDVVHLDRGLQ